MGKRILLGLLALFAFTACEGPSEYEKKYPIHVKAYNGNCGCYQHYYVDSLSNGYVYRDGLKVPISDVIRVEFTNK